MCIYAEHVVAARTAAHFVGVSRAGHDVAPIPRVLVVKHLFAVNLVTYGGGRRGGLAGGGARKG